MNTQFQTANAANAAGARSVLIAYDQTNADVLRTCGIPGAIVQLKGLK